MKMEKNNVYITNLCVGHKSIYYQSPELPSGIIRDDLNELLEDKYVTKVNMEFVYVDCDGIKYSGEVTVNGIDDYEDLIMEDDNFHEKTMLTDVNIIDLFEFD